MWILYIITHLFYLSALIIICVDNGKLRKKIADLQSKLSDIAIDYVAMRRKLRFYISVTDDLERENKKLKNQEKDETN